MAFRARTNESQRRPAGCLSNLQADNSVVQRSSGGMSAIAYSAMDPSAEWWAGIAGPLQGAWSLAIFGDGGNVYSPSRPDRLRKFEESGASVSGSEQTARGCGVDLGVSPEGVKVMVSFSTTQFGKLFRSVLSATICQAATLVAQQFLSMIRSKKSLRRSPAQKAAVRTSCYL